MTILDKLVTRFTNKINATGLTVYILSSHNKHPRQNAMLQTLATRLTAEGVNVQFREQNENISGRGILIVLDDQRNLETRNQWDKIINSNQLRWILTIGSGFVEEELEGDWELVQEFDELDIDGAEHIQIWKRVKVRI